jgi:TRAP transporter 4TM/12TM fusion protein
MIVELQSAKYGLRGLPKAELPNFRKVFRERGHMILPILVLIYCVAGLGMSTSRSGFWAIVTCAAVSQLRPTTRMNLKKIVTALEKGAKGSLIVAACCASAGLITGVITMTGMGLRFSDILVTLAGGSMIVLLIFTMLASLILGLPLPPVTCYLILAVLAAPALIKAGVNPMAAHLFVFFFGALGNISPPVAPTSFAAAGLAETDPIKTTNLTFYYSMPSFLVPYLYVYANELLLMGPPGMVILRVISSFVGLSCMAVTFHGHLFRGLNWMERLAFLIGGLMLVYPHLWSSLMGYLFIGLLLSREFLKLRAQKSLSVSGEGKM